MKCLNPVATHAVNDGLCTVIHGFGAVHNGSAVLVVVNVLHRGNAVAERFGTVADGAAARNAANNVKPVLNLGCSDVNVRNVEVHFYWCIGVLIGSVYTTSQYFIFILFVLYFVCFVFCLFCILFVL